MFTASFKPIQPCPLPANHVLLCYYCSLLSPCLVCMLRMVRYYPITPWFGISHYYIVVDDMIIIMLTIFDEGWKVYAIPPRRFVPFESPRPRVPGIGFQMSVPNRVWDFMGSPLLTYLASNIPVVSQADLTFENMHIYLVGSLLADIF